MAWLSGREAGQPVRRRDTLEEERSEVIQTVLEVMERDDGDPWRAAACRFLLSHLVGMRPERRVDPPELSARLSVAGVL